MVGVVVAASASLWFVGRSVLSMCKKVVTAGDLVDL